MTSSTTSPVGTETANLNTGISLKWDTFSNSVNGELLSTNTTRHSINPATGDPNPEVPLSTKEDVERAMEAAKAAFKYWAGTSTLKRRTALLAFANDLEAEKEAFSAYLVKEQGKPVPTIHPSLLRKSNILTTPTASLRQSRNGLSPPLDENTHQFRPA